MAEKWQTARRVLVIRLDSIGDVLMATPAIRAVREAPGVDHVALLTSPQGAAIARFIPELDAVLTYEAPWMKAGDERGVVADEGVIAAMRGFDAAIILTTYSQTPFPAAMLCRLAGIPLVLAHCRERAYRLVSDAVPESEPERGVRHEVDRQLDLVATLGWRPSHARLSLSVPPDARAAVEDMLGRERLGVARWAVLHPGATAPSRRYPPGQMGAAARRLADEDGWRFLVTGSRDEAPLAAAVTSAAGPAAIDVSGGLTLAELTALIARAPLLITNNSGPAHIAAAMGTPVVDLYALTNPQHTPWAVPARVLSHDVPCRWCYKSICPEGHHRCLTGIAPDTVAEAARDLVAETRQTRLAVA